MSTQTPAPSTDRETPQRLLHRLDWQVLRRLDGMLQGDYRSLFMGGGLDFAELREYQPPDDIRHIDWNVTARMDSPYVRRFLEDREVTAWFLVDLSPSMAFGAVERQKESVIVDLVGLLARLLTRNGNRVGAILYDNSVALTIPPRSGRSQVLRLINDIQRQQSSPALRQGQDDKARDGKAQDDKAREGKAQDDKARDGKAQDNRAREGKGQGGMTDLAGLLESTHNSVKRRSLVFVVSDFICLPGWDGALDRLNRKHELLAVRVWDPRETELPDVGVVVVEDSETGAQMTVDTSDRGFRRRFHEAAQQREEELAQTFKHAGVDELTLSTEEDIVLAILRFASLRSRSLGKLRRR